MAKAKTTPKRRYHELTTPTHTSRILTWLMLLLIPVIAFFLGMRYQESQDQLKMFDLQEQMIMEQMETSTPSADLP